MFIALQGETVAHSGADLEAIAYQLAMQWLDLQQQAVSLVL